MQLYSDMVPLDLVSPQQGFSPGPLTPRFKGFPATREFCPLPFVCFLCGTRHRAWKSLLTGVYDVSMHVGKQTAAAYSCVLADSHVYDTVHYISLKNNCPLSTNCLPHPFKGDFTRDNSQRQFLVQHSVPMLEQCCNHSKQCCNLVLC